MLRFWVLFNSHNYLVGWMSCHPPLFRWGAWVSERWTDCSRSSRGEEKSWGRNSDRSPPPLAFRNLPWRQWKPGWWSRLGSGPSRWASPCLSATPNSAGSPGGTITVERSLRVRALTCVCVCPWVFAWTTWTTEILRNIFTKMPAGDGWCKHGAQSSVWGLITREMMLCNDRNACTTCFLCARGVERQTALLSIDHNSTCFVRLLCCEV